jgi:hypothetical protein
VLCVEQLLLAVSSRLKHDAQRCGVVHDLPRVVESGMETQWQCDENDAVSGTASGVCDDDSSGSRSGGGGGGGSVCARVCVCVRACVCVEGGGGDISYEFMAPQVIATVEPPVAVYPLERCAGHLDRVAVGCRVSLHVSVLPNLS